MKQNVLPKGHLPQQEALCVVELLAGAGFGKITFAGGEPTLCPWLGGLISRARELGLTTMLVTNGSRLAEAAWLDRHGRDLDWVALSIDSADPGTHEGTGRSLKGRAITPSTYLDIAGQIRRRGIRLKVNTVVTSANWQEDMAGFVAALGPERWKVLRVLPVAGQNEGKVDPLLVSDLQFRAFCERNRRAVPHRVTLVPEDHEDIIGGYAMVDPAGRFFDNTSGGHTYSRPILEAGVHAAWQDIRFYPERFAARGGRYEWGGPSPLTQISPTGRRAAR